MEEITLSNKLTKLGASLSREGVTSTDGENVEAEEIQLFDIGGLRLYSRLLRKSGIWKLEEIPECGRNLKIHFKLGSLQLTDVFSKQLEHVGSLSFISKLGSVPEQDIDLENIAKLQGICISWARNFGIWKEEDSSEIQKLSGIGIPTLCALTVPGLKLKDLEVYMLCPS
jgi:hypothetical protein